MPPYGRGGIVTYTSATVMPVLDRQLKRVPAEEILAGFPFSWLQKIPGLFRTPEAFFHDPVVSQQCLNF